MNALVRICTERGDTRLLLRAQCSAEGFYARLGLVAVGERLVEAGVPHIDMVRTLGPL